jgi:hypothetical protein
MEVKKIFGNVEVILNVNRELLSDIRARSLRLSSSLPLAVLSHCFLSASRIQCCFRVEGWHTGQLLGDVFVRFAPFLKVYVDYAANYDAAIDLSTRLLQDRKDYAALMYPSYTTLLYSISPLPLSSYWRHNARS